VEGFCANFESGKDDASTEDTAVVNEVDCDGGSEVGDDDGFFGYGVGGCCGDDAVGTDFAGLIDGQAYWVGDVFWD